MESPKLQKGLGAIASSLNHIGGTIGNALEVSFRRNSPNAIEFSAAAKSFNHDAEINCNKFIIFFG